MIVDVKKYLFFGTAQELDAFFERCMEEGIVEFISPSGKKSVEVPGDIQTLLSALKILRKLPPKKSYMGGGTHSFAMDLAQRILTLKLEIDKLTEEERILEAEIVRVAPFGDFSMEDIDFIEQEGDRKVQFFCMKTAKSHKTNFADEVVYVNTVYDLDYFLAINREPTTYPGMIEMRIDRPVGQLQNHLAFLRESLHLLEAELKGFAGHGEFLHDILLEKLNEHHLAAAKKEVAYPLDEPSLFVIEGWIPKDKVPTLFAAIEGMAIEAEEIALEEGERIPTEMENKGPNRIGEDLVKIYDTPSAKDKDPSGWVFWFFALFFAIIVSDAGYGFLFLATAAFLHFKFPNAIGMAKRFFKLSATLAVACILWGVATASFFGISPHPESPVSRFSLLGHLAEKKAEYHFQKKDDVYQYWIKEIPALSSAQNGKEFLFGAQVMKEGKLQYVMLDDFRDNIMLEISLLIGVIHVSLSAFRYARRNLAGLGWVTFLVGGYLFFPSILNSTSLIHFLGWVDKETGAKIGEQLVYGGIAMAMILALIQKKLKGLAEAATMIQVCADVLSYLRLYALALAGSMMASTFNDMGLGIGLAVGFVIILFGHAINILLSIMAGVIHGLRLNFIEWYHYSFEGGGKLFNPLKKLKSH